MNEKYIKISDLKRKLYYIFRIYGTTSTVKNAVYEAIKKIPYTVKGELETTLENIPVKHGETNKKHIEVLKALKAEADKYSTHPQEIKDALGAAIKALEAGEE